MVVVVVVVVSCPADVNVPSKQQEKLHKYCPLALDFRSMYNMPVKIVPVVFGCTGVVSVDCIKHLRDIPGFCDSLFATLQKAALIGTVHTLRTINLA